MDWWLTFPKAPLPMALRMWKWLKSTAEGGKTIRVNRWLNKDSHSVAEKKTVTQWLNKDSHSVAAQTVNRWLHKQSIAG